MRRTTRWAASALGAAGVGAGIAVVRHRRRPPGLAPPPARPTHAAVADRDDTSAPEDPQAALDAARQRLRERADEVRRDIESSSDA